MVVSPRSSHAFATFVVRDNIVVIRELFLADWADSVLLADLPVEQFPHLSPRSELPIPPWVMRILDTLNTQPDQLWFRYEFPATAGNRLVDRTDFIGTESHGGSPLISGMGLPKEGRRAGSTQQGKLGPLWGC